MDGVVVVGVYGPEIVAPHEEVDIDGCIGMTDCEGCQRMVAVFFGPVYVVDYLTCAFGFEDGCDFVEICVVKLREIRDMEFHNLEFLRLIDLTVKN